MNSLGDDSPQPFRTEESNDGEAEMWTPKEKFPRSSPVPVGAWS